jgi:hypothetical protein
MRQHCIVQSGIDERFRVGVGVARRCGKGHSAAPIVRRFRMDSAKYHPSFAARCFDDRRRAVGILAHNRPPTGKLRAILRVMLAICQRMPGTNNFLQRNNQNSQDCRPKYLSAEHTRIDRQLSLSNSGRRLMEPRSCRAWAHSSPIISSPNTSKRNCRSACKNRGTLMGFQRCWRHGLITGFQTAFMQRLATEGYMEPDGKLPGRC